MPQYDVTLSDGKKYRVTTDRAPSSPDELNLSVTQALKSKGIDVQGGPAPSGGGASSHEQPFSLTEGFKGLGAKVWDAVKSTGRDIGYSFGVKDEPQGEGGATTGIFGRTREALQGRTEGIMPIGQMLLPPFIRDNPRGWPKTTQWANVASGAAQDLLNMSAVLSPLYEGAKAALPAIGRRLVPGAAVGMSDAAIESLEKLPGKAIQGPPPGPLWDAFRQSGYPAIEMANTKRAILESIDLLHESANPDKEAVKFLTNIYDRMEKYGDQLPMNLFDADRKDIGGWVGSAGRGLDEKVSDKMYSAMNRDLDFAESQAGRLGAEAGNLKEAIYASKKQFAREDLAKLIDSKVSTQAETGFKAPGVTQIQDALRKTKKGQEIMSRLDPGEIDSINQGLKDWEKISKLPPRGQYGSGRVLTWASMATLLGKVLGVPPVEMVGGAIAGKELIGMALTSERGRAIVKALAQKNITVQFPTKTAAAFAGKEVMRQTGKNQQETP